MLKLPKMDNNETKKGILDYDLFDICGLDIDPLTKLDIESGIYKSALIDLLENKLPSLIGDDRYSELESRMDEVDLSDTEKFMASLKGLCSEYNIEVDSIVNESLEEIQEDFIEDQINFFERKAAKIKDETQRELKLSSVRDLKSLFKNKAWADMGEVFKSANLYTMPEPLALHL